MSYHDNKILKIKKIL